MKYVKGDVTEATERWIMHGCNCQGVMGGGVAWAIRQKFPKAYDVYRDYCKGTDSSLLLGDYCLAQINHMRTIVNLFTQENFGGDGQVYASLLAIRSSITRFLFDQFNKDYCVSIAMPKIGAGLGGLKWYDVELVLQKIENENPNVEFVIYEI